MESFRFGMLHPDVAPRGGEIPNKPIIVDLDEVFGSTTNEGAIVASKIVSLWAALCGHALSDKDFEKRVSKAIKSKLREGYFTIKGHTNYTFFLGIDGKVYPHNYPSSVQCRVTDYAGHVTSIGTAPPHWAEILLSVVQQLLRDWHLNELKKGHRERTKDRVININKQG